MTAMQQYAHAAQSSGDALPAKDSRRGISRRGLGARLLAAGVAGPAAVELSECRPAQAEALTLKDVTRTVTPAGPLSSRWSKDHEIVLCLEARIYMSRLLHMVNTSASIAAYPVFCRREEAIISIFEQNTYSVVNVVDVTLAVSDS